jgi:hypothetical protein
MATRTQRREQREQFQDQTERDIYREEYSLLRRICVEYFGANGVVGLETKIGQELRKALGPDVALREASTAPEPSWDAKLREAAFHEERERVFVKITGWLGWKDGEDEFVKLRELLHDTNVG